MASKATRCSPEKKAQVVQQLLAPGADLHAISKESGVSVPTLYSWKEAVEAAGRAEVRTLDDERTTNAPLRDATSLAKRVRVLEAELARKNENIAELSVLVLQAKGMLKGKKKGESE